MRNRITKRLAVSALAIALCSVPAGQAQAFEVSDVLDPIKTAYGVVVDPIKAGFDVVRDPIKIGFDVIIVRPLTFSTIVVGATLLVPALVLSAAEGEESWKNAVELFVTIPYEDAFARELGQF